MSAVDKAREALCRMLASGELSPGQRLPGEVELCGRLGLSRSSLREAQKMLVAVGVLDSHPGGRLTVSDFSASTLMSGLDMVVPLLPLDRLLELFPMRQVLEGHTTMRATALMSDEELDDLVALALHVCELPPDDPSADPLDQEFHLRINRAAGDEMIAALLETIHHRGEDYHVLADEDFRRRSNETHLRIARAMAARDGQLARALMVSHIQDSRDRLAEAHPAPRPKG